MTKEELQTLFQRYHDGTASEEERALLEAWYVQQDESDSRILSRQAIDAAKAQVFRRLPGNETEFLKIGLRMLAAAMLIGLLIAVGILLFPSKRGATPGLARHDVPPGGNKALLTLSSGKEIDLTAAAKGQLINSAGLKVTKTRQGRVLFHYSGAVASPAQHTLSTPKGGQWQVVLADGTKVWLNAASSLSFPSSFSGSANRQVQLSGEGYFEVAKDPAHPFIVLAGRQRVEVLGTHFNISSYAEDQAITTTLTEGSVKVKLLNGPDGAVLKPGEQSVVRDSRIVVQPADVQAALAWKNGYFRFNDEPITGVMKKLARWYNVEVRYEGPIPEEGLNGKISRNKNISQVIQALEATGIVHFTMEGRRVAVMR